MGKGKKRKTRLSANLITIEKSRKQEQFRQGLIRTVGRHSTDAIDRLMGRYVYGHP